MFHTLRWWSGLPWRRGSRLFVLYFVLCCAIAVAQNPPPAILEIDAENLVAYYGNVFDMSKFATDPNLTTIAGGPRTFTSFLAIGDIVAVNGKPAKGASLLRGQLVSLSPTPSPGQSTADVVRSSVTEYFLEIQQPDGTPVGSLFAAGVGSGSAPPGAPLAVQISNNTLLGGTGAFLGARGQLGGRTFAGTAFLRTASVAEDPSMRRVLGGGKLRFVVHLLPMCRPETSALVDGQAIFHGSDFTPVTAGRPARPGELLVLSAAGLGPTTPNLGPDVPFPSYQEGKLHQVNAPVEVYVNGRPAAVSNVVGWPGLTGIYRVDFTVPPDTAAGAAVVSLTAAWIQGPEVRVPVR